MYVAAQGLSAGSLPFGQQNAMANVAQAQLEALLGAKSSSQQPGHMSGMQHDYGGVWAGHGRAGVSPASQVCWRPIRL